MARKSQYRNFCTVEFDLTRKFSSLAFLLPSSKTERDNLSRNDYKFQVPTTCFQSSRSIAEREDPQAVTVTAAARSAATQRGLRGPVCRHRGSQHAARSADCGEELRGASAKRWRSVAECMHGAKERSQREALAECWRCNRRSQREGLAEPAGSRWRRKGISAERCAHCALHSSTWCSSDLKDGCPLETCSSQDRDSLPPRVGLRSDAVMSNLLSSPQTPGGTAVSCYATSLPLPLSPDDQYPNDPPGVFMVRLVKLHRVS